VAVIPKVLYPDVPQLPGVPQLRRAATGAALRAGGALVTSLLAPARSGRLWHPPQSETRWGVYNAKHELVLHPDSILDFDQRNEWSLPTYPLQSGSFSNYNKVNLPFEISVRVSKGGTRQQRTLFLEEIAKISATLDLYTILTPERSYLNCNIVRYEVSRRGAAGAYFLTDVDLFFREIRQTTPQVANPDADTTDAQNPDARPPVAQGTRQTQTPPASASFDRLTNLRATP